MDQDNYTNDKKEGDSMKAIVYSGIIITIIYILTLIF